MNVAFTRRATADLARIGAQSRRAFGPAVAAALETFIRATIARLAVFPESGLRLPRRPKVFVVPLVRYPFKIFYTYTVIPSPSFISDMLHAGVGKESERRKRGRS
jgi:plasmid stabilization system protein ParE